MKQFKDMLITTARCLVCFSKENHHLLAELDQFNVYECACKHRFIDPCLSPEAMTVIYESSDQLGEVNSMLEQYYDYNVLAKGSRTRKQFSKTLRFISRFSSGMKLLDVASGAGDFAKFASDHGWNVTAVDSSKKNTERAQRRGLTAICVDFLNFDTDEQFDVITMWDFLEHVPDPGALLKKAGSLLKSNGFIFIASPLYPNLLSILAEAIYRVSFKKSRGAMERMYVVEHTSYFSFHSLKSLLESSGFSLLKSWREETDLNRYRLPLLLKAAFRILFLLARCCRLENRINVIAKKK
jgi:ubiquinone/menaquinone biosynthesis C-methylase UbiE